MPLQLLAAGVEALAGWGCAMILDDRLKPPLLKLAPRLKYARLDHLLDEIRILVYLCPGSETRPVARAVFKTV